MLDSREVARVWSRCW